MLTRRVMLNSVAALVSKLLLIAAGFLLQRVMIDALGTATVGLNSVFANVISILSLAELGISTAIVFHLYAPLANRDEAAVRSLMRLYARCYRVIAAVVLALGLAVMPFVHLLLKDSTFPLDYVRLIFLLFLLRTVSSYLLSYKRSLLMADQRTGLVSIVDLAAQLMSMLTGIALLYTTRNLRYYLLSCIVWTVLGNLAIVLLVRRIYPYMRGKLTEPVSPALSKAVFKDVKNVFVMRISGVILTSTDSVIISSCVSVIAAGLYDNYYQIINALLSIIIAVTNAVQPTLGHLFAKRERDSLDSVLRNYTFVFYLLGTAIGTALICLITPFVTRVWLGAQYELDFPVVCILVTNFFLLTLRNPLWSLLTVSGLFAKDKNIAIIGASTNLVVSLALVYPLGLLGVFIGTFVSQALQVVLKAKLLYKRGLERSVKPYAREFCVGFALFLVQATIAYALCSLIALPSAWLELLAKAVVCLTFVFLVNLLLFGRGERWRAFVSLLKSTLRREKETA